MKKYLKRLISYIIVVVVSLSMSGISSASAASYYKMYVNYINVGESDCVLIQSAGHNMMIDAGNNGDGDDIVNYLENKKVKKLDYIISTHPHADHCGGMDDVIESFSVGKIIMTKLTNNTQTFKDVKAAMQDKGLKATNPKVGAKYVIGKAKFTILGPTDADRNINNNSVAIRLVNGKTSFIFIGDSEKDEINDILHDGINIDSDVYMTGHHGSDTSTTKALLDKVTPDDAVISVGKNSYGHPGSNTLGLLKEEKIKTYRTDKSGSIVATSTGTKVSFNTKAVTLLGTTVTAKSSKSSTNKSIVYVTKTGTKYHRAGCQYLRGSKIKTTVKQAKADGYTPCSKCNPPK